MSGAYLEIQRMKEFLLLYKGFPCLWDCKSDQFKDKGARERALDVLLNKYKIMVPDANKDTLKRKIDMMKSSYKRELKKVLDDHSHKPSLWYFPYLKFLDEPIFTTLVQSGDSSDAEAETTASNLTLLNQDDDDDDDIDDDDDAMASVDHSNDKSVEEKETITIFYHSDDDGDSEYEDLRDEVPELANTLAPQINKNSVLYSLLTSDVDQLKKAKLHIQTARKYPYEDMDEPSAKRLKPLTPTTSDREPSDRLQYIERQQPIIIQRQSARKRTTQIPSTPKRTKSDPLTITPESPATLEYPISLSSPEPETSLSTKSEDETIAFGKAIGIQMKELTPLQKTVATKLISDVIFYGRLDRLTTQTNINNLKK